jgi:SAM-dependent methyltransferase
MFYIVECAQCRLIRLYPRPQPEELSGFYPETYWHDPGNDQADRLAAFWRRFVLRDHLRFIRQALARTTAKGAVLDVGCGGGLLLRELGLPPGQAFGLDFSLSAAAVAWGTNGVPAVCASLTRAPLREGSCRLVTMFHVLEHLFDPASYLNAARQLLAPDGRLIVQVPNASCWQFLFFGESWNGLDVPRHLIDFRLQDLETLLAECGFDVLRVKHFSLRDNPAGFASSVAAGLDPMGRRVRGADSSPRMKLVKDLAYFALVLAAIPPTLIESLCRAGSTVMVEARPKS